MFSRHLHIPNTYGARIRHCDKVLSAAVMFVLFVFQVHAQSVTDMAVLKGLAPLTVLPNTPNGIAALGANYSVTGGIQTGVIRQATLLPFAEQQQQALKDAFITFGDLAQLADGLGTTLGSGYLARAHYSDQSHFTNISSAMASVIAYAQGTTGANSSSGKYFFANATTDGKSGVSADALAILQKINGETDVYGKSYHLLAGSPGADAFGDSRPFQTEPSVSTIIGLDYLNAPSDNGVYNRGPVMNLVNSPSFPSGHTTYGYTGAVTLAVLVPARYSQMIVRGAEYGNDRILMGAHYAMDVIGGRTLALYDMAHLLANDPAYLGRPAKGDETIKDFQGAIKAARIDLTKALESACGKPVAECALEDTGRFSNRAANQVFYSGTLTYDLPVVYAKNAVTLEDVGKVAPEAGFLLTAAFPSLTLQQADDILTETEGPGGGFLDDGSSFGVYSRLDLYAAAERVAALAAAPASSTRASKPFERRIKFP